MSQVQAEDTVYYYGKCPNPGKIAKWHTGHEVVPYLRDDSILVVRTHCGNQMFQEGEGERPPTLDEGSEELCKTCHRSYAWQVMKDALAHRREVEDELAQQLDELVFRVENNDLNDIGVVRELRGLSERLRHKVRELPQGFSAKGNLRVVEGATA